MPEASLSGLPSDGMQAPTPARMLSTLVEQCSTQAYAVEAALAVHMLTLVCLGLASAIVVRGELNTRAKLAGDLHRMRPLRFGSAHVLLLLSFVAAAAFAGANCTVARAPRPSLSRDRTPPSPIARGRHRVCCCRVDKNTGHGDGSETSPDVSHIWDCGVEQSGLKGNRHVGAAH